MNRYYLAITVWLYSFLGALSSNAYSGIPVWTFKPLTATQITVAQNGTASVQYQVINQSARPHTLVMKPMRGITQITGPGLCRNPLVLPTRGSSCVLSLQVNGALLTKPVSGGPVLCQRGNDAQCYRPSPRDILNIKLSSSRYMISGTVSGLTTNGLILQNNGENLPLAANATAFTFPTPVTAGSSYNVTVAQQPSGASCNVSNGSGIATTNINNVLVTCTISGILSSVVGSPFAADQYPVAAIVSPDNNFLYVANASSNNISGYSINPITGVLTPIPGSPFVAGTGPTDFVVTADGQFLYVANALATRFPATL